MRKHRRAVVFLGAERIERMLALPEGLQFVAARDDFQRNGVAVIVEGGALEPVDEAACLPDLPLAVLDRTELAMTADIRGNWLRDSAALSVTCPLRNHRPTGCDWYREWEYEQTTLGKVVDVVQQHLSEKHAEESAT